MPNEVKVADEKSVKKTPTTAQVKSIIERIEKLEDERATTRDLIKDIYTEAAGNGFDKKALKQVVRLRKKDKDERDRMDATVQTYLSAVE